MKTMNNTIDRFTLSAAAAHLVDAYKKVTAEYLRDYPRLNIKVTQDGVSSFGELFHGFANGTLVINTSHSETCIYGRDGNVAFRTMHDLGHCVGHYLFIADDEVALALEQWPAVKAHLPEAWVGICERVYLADTVGQTEFEVKHGHFPADQKAFVMSRVIL